MSCLDVSEMALYMCDQLDREKAALVATHLRTCQTCQTLYDELKTCASYLVPEAEAFDTINLAPSIMEIIRKEEAVEQRPTAQPNWLSSWRHRFANERTWMIVRVTAAITLFLVSGVLYLQHANTPPKGEFLARGIVSNEPESWTSISVFRRIGEEYQLVDSNFIAEDYLAFSYINGADSTARFLMIFAVDKNNNVFWYYPTHDDPKRVPCSVAIESTGEVVRLPDEIRHSFSAGPLRMWALFSPEPLCVDQIEALFQLRDNLKGAFLRMERLPISNTIQQSLLFDVSTGLSQE